MGLRVGVGVGVGVGVRVQRGDLGNELVHDLGRVRVRVTLRGRGRLR